jgi:hypothetical protein
MEPYFEPYHITLILVALITGVISPIILQTTKFFVLRLLQGKPNPGFSTKVAKKESFISEKLEGVLKKYNADRVWIVEFHNGGYSYSGRSLQKFSVTYETTEKGVSTESLATQNLPTSILIKFFTYLEENGFYIIKETTKVRDPVGLSIQSFLESRSVESFCACAIKDIRNTFVGILCLDGVNSQIAVDQNNISELIYTAANLAGYLENVDKSREKNK